MADYAVVETGGKQYKVSPGDTVDVEKLTAEVGALVELDNVQLISRETGIVLGSPRIDGARVIAEVQEQFRGPKIIIFKYKPKTRYRKKNGHRQSYTRLRIEEIRVDVNQTEVSDSPPSPAPSKRTGTTRSAPTKPTQRKVKEPTNGS